MFRSEAVKARQIKWLSDITLFRPLSFTFLTLIAGFVATIILLFFLFVSYTKRSTVYGQLEPNPGLIKIYVPQQGIVLKKFAYEGQLVKAGDILYVLSSDRQSSTQGDTQAAVSNLVESRQTSLRDELTKTHILQQQESEALKKKIDGLKSELLNLTGQIDGQKNRIKFSEDTIIRYQNLNEQGFISKEQLQQKREDLLDQQNRLRMQERDFITVQRDLTSQQKDLLGLSLKHENQLAPISRGISSAKQELTESEVKRRLIITAPEAGFVTTVVAEVGQAVDISKPLASVIPINALLEAHLYAPSKSIGFIKEGDIVLLRYQAFPFQKFGQGKGTVTSISRTALASNELTNMGNSGMSGSNNNEPMYRIIVNIPMQNVTAYGKKQPLQVGMLLEADILLETRRLYEWILEPMFSLTGKL